MSDYRRVPLNPPGYPCNDPDYSKPLPGEVLNWPGLSNFVPRRPPIGLLQDPWAKAQALSFCVPKRTLPPVVFNGAANPAPPFSIF